MNDKKQIPLPNSQKMHFIPGSIKIVTPCIKDTLWSPWFFRETMQLNWVVSGETSDFKHKHGSITAHQHDAE